MELILALGVGTALGVLTGLGIGGGSLLLLFLTLILHMDPATARGISLLFFFPASAVSCFLHRKSIPWKDLGPAIAAGILAAALFSLISKRLEPLWLKKFLGLLFLSVGIRELFFKNSPSSR